ncbi:sterile alpha motif domain-containing protein 1-like [Nerophis ophidion]|uniref:sterile alpha motif domain-containing protein 1-like n=1 Tax=Nerophis ophidion TaxID=159077 RepID=UPI002ADF4934|nr:sterile alpha motif domain-containing protein 1-like [Nerophis ophidion]
MTSAAFTPPMTSAAFTPPMTSAASTPAPTSAPQPPPAEVSVLAAAPAALSAVSGPASARPPPRQPRMWPCPGRPPRGMHSSLFRPMMWLFRGRPPRQFQRRSTRRRHLTFPRWLRGHKGTSGICSLRGRSCNDLSLTF